MAELTRRDAVRLVAAGAGALVLSQGAAKADEKSDVEKAGKNLRTDYTATVAHVRSFDRHVYLWISDTLKGWVDLNQGTGSTATDMTRLGTFAVAAAAAAAGKKVNCRVWGYDPNWGGGAGHFDRVELWL